MKLKDIELIRLLPEFMRKDSANIGLAKGFDQIIKMYAKYGEHLSIWTAIDELTEAELDELAWEFNVTWYEYSSDLETKRKLIKNSTEVKRNLGTGWAVERVISTYFGEGRIEEWFEYGGRPGYFKVISSNPTITQENLDKFLRVLEKVKRKSAHLEGICVGLSGKNYLNVGIGCREAEVITIRPERGSVEGWENGLLMGAAARDTEKLMIRPVYTEKEA
ncbi:phage tail protein I [bacterium 210820-DFI.6.37]|nr:phage tail protein I [bacterium 210820-DFI.6.37]